MILLNNSVPGARVVHNSSSSAEPLDDSFMGHFETVNPNDLHDQLDADYWADQPQDGVFLQENRFLYTQEVDGGVGSNVDAQHDTSSEQGSDAVYQLQATHDPNNGTGNNSDIQHIPRLEQVHDAWDEVHDVQYPNNGTYHGMDSNENPQFPYSDQFYQQMVNSNKYLQDPVFDIDFNPGFQLDDFGPPVNTENLNQEHLDQVADLGTADNGPVYHSQEPQGRFINPSLTWTGQVPLDQVSPIGAENGSLYRSQGLPGEFIEPGINRSDSAPKIEQAPFVLESLPQAPYPSLHPPIHIPPDNQHLNGENTLPPTPKRKRSKGHPYKRQANIESRDPSKFYQSLPKAPSSWKPYPDSDVTFRYNEYGNLCTDDKFSGDDIQNYLYYHALNCYGYDGYDPKNGGLTLWIQTVPADAAERYPDKKSDKCRFADCPIQGGSIRKGFFRVAFDEHSRSGRLIDPYHCAGFVHLFCLEKFCNFPKICQDFNVQPDQREFDDGKNKMAVTRDHREMAEVVRAFMRSSEKPEPWDYEQTLCFQLTSKHLELQPKTRQNKRVERGGNHIELHKGDLDKFVVGESLKNERRKNASKDEKSSKRKRDTFEEEEGTPNLKIELKEEERQTKRIMRDFR